LKPQITFVGDVSRFGTQIEFEINFGQIQIAKSEDMSVSVFLALFPCGAEHLDGTAVLAAQVIEVSDVVVALRDEKRHAMLNAHFARALVSAESAREIIQGNQANGHVVKGHGEAFGVTKRQKHLVGAFIACKTLFKAILPMIDIPDVDFEVAEALLVAKALKDFPGGLCGV